ncbi:MAG: lipopolysaccharide biosynthesis protein [Gammaproteobacteria bacterium]|nr:hypothetical protein [Gammaproteobacteria bacterium]
MQLTNRIGSTASEAAHQDLASDRLGRTAVRSVGWVVVDRWGTRIASLLTIVVLGRLLAPHDFGLVALAAMFMSFATIFVEQGFGKALIQKRVLREEHTQSAFWASFATAIVLTLSVILVAPLVASATGTPELAAVLRWMSIGLIVNALTCTPYALLERDFRFKALAIRRLASTVIGSLTGIALALAGWGVWSLVTQTLVTSIVGLVALWAACDWRPRSRPRLAALRELWPVGFGVLGIELLAFVGSQADRFLVGAFLGAQALGWYYMAMKIVTIMIEIFSSVFSAVSLPMFSRLQEDRARLCTWLYRLTSASSAITLPCFALAAALAPLLLPFVLGEQWTASVRIFQVLALLGAINAVAYFDRNVLLATGRARDALLLTLGQAILGVILILIAAPYGVLAIAIAVVARQYLYWPVRIALLRLTIGIDPKRYLAQWSRPFIAAVLTGVAVAALVQRWPLADTIRTLMLGTGLGALLYLVMLGVIYPVIYTDVRETLLRTRKQHARVQP